VPEGQQVQLQIKELCHDDPTKKACLNVTENVSKFEWNVTKS